MSPVRFVLPATSNLPKEPVELALPLICALPKSKLPSADADIDATTELFPGFTNLSEPVDMYAVFQARVAEPKSYVFCAFGKIELLACIVCADWLITKAVDVFKASIPLGLCSSAPDKLECTFAISYSLITMLYKLQHLP